MSYLLTLKRTMNSAKTYKADLLSRTLAVGQLTLHIGHIDAENKWGKSRLEEPLPADLVEIHQMWFLVRPCSHEGRHGRKCWRTTDDKIKPCDSVSTVGSATSGPVQSHGSSGSSRSSLQKILWKCTHPRWAEATSVALLLPGASWTMKMGGNQESLQKEDRSPT